MTKTITKETLRRALRTFGQTVIGYIAVNVALVDFTASGDVIKSALIGILIAGVSAGISAVMNLENKEVENYE